MRRYGCGCLLGDMNGTGVRNGWGVPGFSGSSGVPDLPNLSGLSRTERIDALRSRMAAMGATATTVTTAATALQPDPQPGHPAAAHPGAQQFRREDILPAPDAFSGLLPGGGLPRRAVTLATEQPLLAVEYLAHVTARGGHAAVVGWPDLAYAGVIDAGGVCANIIAVPDPGPEPFGIVSVLCAGLDLVLYRGPELALSPTRARPLLGRLRSGTAALLMMGTRVPAPALTVESEITGYLGIGPGRGRIRGVELELRVSAKGRAPVHGQVLISRPQDAALLHAPDSGVPFKPGLRVV